MMKYGLKLIAWIKKKILRCDLFGHTSLARELASGCPRNWCAKLPRTAVGCACRNTVAGRRCSCRGGYYRPLLIVTSQHMVIHYLHEYGILAIIV
jgi:hypothetical protein